MAKSIKEKLAEAKQRGAVLPASHTIEIVKEVKEEEVKQTPIKAEEAPKMEEKKAKKDKVMTTLWMDRHLKEYLDFLSYYDKTPKSEIVNTLILEYIKKREEKDPALFAHQNLPKLNIE